MLLSTLSMSKIWCESEQTRIYRQACDSSDNVPFGCARLHLFSYFLQNQLQTPMYQFQSTNGALIDFMDMDSPFDHTIDGLLEKKKCSKKYTFEVAETSSIPKLVNHTAAMPLICYLVRRYDIHNIQLMSMLSISHRLLQLVPKDVANIPIAWK